MSISTERLLRHMAWANQRVFGAVSSLPDESLNSYVTNPEWTVAEILWHIVAGADSYTARLTGTNKSAIQKPSQISDVTVLAEGLKNLDSRLLEVGRLEDEPMTKEIDGKQVTHMRSTIISQVIHHATEHRAQLIGALEFRGFNPINLDDIDLWAFEEYQA